MKRTLKGIVEVGEPLIQEALAALRLHNEAQAAGEAPDQVERLCLVAESAYQAVNDCQLYAFGNQQLKRH